MNPVSFKEQNCIIHESGEHYLPLPAYCDPYEGEVISCWDLDEDELEQVLKTGKIWLRMLTFNQPLQPIGLSCLKPEMMQPIDLKYCEVKPNLE